MNEHCERVRRVREVLEAVAPGPLFGIEIEPEEHRQPGGPKPTTEAIVRCEGEGWIRTGPASSCDPRIHITKKGREEILRRSS